MAVSSAAANQQIADDIVRRCVFDFSPVTRSPAVARNSCDSCPRRAAARNMHNTASSASTTPSHGVETELDSVMGQLHVRAPVVPQMRVSVGGGDMGEGRGERARRRSGSMSPRISAHTGGDEDQGGAARVEQLFLPRCYELSEMVRGAKEASDMLALAAGVCACVCVYACGRIYIFKKRPAKCCRTGFIYTHTLSLTHTHTIRRK